MIKIELSENDTIYMLLGIFLCFAGGGVLGVLVMYYTATNLDEIPEGEEPYFTFTTEKE